MESPLILRLTQRPREPESMRSFVRDDHSTEAVSHGVVELAFGRDAIDFDAIEMGSQVWKTDDPQVTQRLRKSFQDK